VVTGGQVTRAGRPRGQCRVPAALREARRLDDFRAWAGGGAARVRVLASVFGEAR
jgi:hypothetical protein